MLSELMVNRAFETWFQGKAVGSCFLPSLVSFSPVSPTVTTARLCWA